MYEAKFLGKVVRITWQELRSLKARFNLKNFTHSYVDSVDMCNRRACVLCAKYRYQTRCEKCPLEVFKGTSLRVACFTMMLRLLNRKNMGFACNPMYVAYNTKQGRNNIEKISVLLERFKKVQ